MRSRLGVVGCAFLVFNVFGLRVSVYVIMVVRARLQAGGVSFSVGKLYTAMQAFVRCWFTYLASRTCAHVSTLEVRPFLPRMETALCTADVGVMTGANKQKQCFGSTLSSVLAQSETAGEMSVILLLGRGVQIYWR